ncbi:MAG: class II aldolase/adducin family protein [Rhodoferax sp.]|nr:class II aldolase/adducin family protein [Rhodoferax sp.]
MTEQQAREEICRIGHSLFVRGYVHATAGNISVRLDDAHGGGFLITPTDACLGFLEPDRLARLDAHAQQISGDKASKTIALHAHIYCAAGQFNPQTRCIIHTHSRHCVALTLRPSDGTALPSGMRPAEPGVLPKPVAAQAELLPPITPYFVMKVGHVPVIPYHRPGDPAAAQQVAQTIRRYGEAGTPIRAVMLSRLGPNVWHDTPAAAMATLEELEETARLMMLSTPVPTALTDFQINELRQTFGALW